ncbi:MAG: DEAD/DEAH box helicase [Candidatus Lokiarchaeota archaeon]|nr:DEAD/DEAH box helicase [Candidatus Lokiarchaeota archaeon]
MQKELKQYLNGPFLKENQILFRDYQKNIVNSCKNKNSLVVLPTGLGKTIIGIMLISNSLKKYSKAKIIILAPTRPLVSQHKASCEKFLDVDLEEITSFTGKIPPEKRILSFISSRIIISTPQVIKNDLIRGRYDLKQVSLLIFDEAHKTKGNYAYNFISEEYVNKCTDPLILGLTASPGKDYERIQQICNNLFIENIVFKNYQDKDVKDFIYDIDTFINLIDLPIKLREISAIWYNLFEKYLRFFVNYKLIAPNKPYYSKLDFLGISRDLTLSLHFENENGLEMSEEEYLECLYYRSPKIIDIVKENRLDIPSVYSYCSSCISILHAKDLLETQNITLFKSFINRIKYKASKDILSAKRIVNSEHFNHINSVIESEDQANLSHPKLEKIISIIKEEFEEFNNKKILIFTQYREMAEFLKNLLKIEFKEQFIIEKFIGQATKIDDNGFPQRLQIEIMEKFRNGLINILIATSVAEEGLDIPNVDAIIFFEPVPSEIRLIQRRGRTGRYAPGRCYILVTEETVDVPFYIVSRRKERSMNLVLSDPEQLVLMKRLERKKIEFPQQKEICLESQIIKNFKERKELEQKYLANRSIENIITQLDDFCNSEEYKNLKNCGITFYSDLLKFDEPVLREKIIKLKSKKIKQSDKQKIYLNKHVKSLINLVKIYSMNGSLDYKKFQELARDEDIIDNKFKVHFNQACFLGYLKKLDNQVQFVMDYD